MIDHDRTGLRALASGCARVAIVILAAASAACTIQIVERPPGGQPPSANDHPVPVVWTAGNGDRDQSPRSDDEHDRDHDHDHGHEHDLPAQASPEAKSHQVPTAGSQEEPGGVARHNPHVHPSHDPAGHDAEHRSATGIAHGRAPDKAADPGHEKADKGHPTRVAEHPQHDTGHAGNEGGEAPPAQAASNHGHGHGTNTPSHGATAQDEPGQRPSVRPHSHRPAKDTNSNAPARLASTEPSPARPEHTHGSSQPQAAQRNAPAAVSDAQAVLREYHKITARYAQGSATDPAEIGSSYGAYQASLKDVTVFYNDAYAAESESRAKTRDLVATITRLARNSADMKQPQHVVAPARDLIGTADDASDQVTADASRSAAALARLQQQGGEYARFAVLAAHDLDGARREDLHAFSALSAGANEVMAYYAYLDHLQAIHHLHFKHGKATVSTAAERAELQRREQAMQAGMRALQSFAQEQG